MATPYPKLNDAVQGAPRPWQDVIWLQQDGTVEDLSGATITGKIEMVSTGAKRAVVGSLPVTDGPAGKFQWRYDAADVAVAGEALVQFTASFGGTPSPARTIACMWVVHRAL